MPEQDDDEFVTLIEQAEQRLADDDHAGCLELCEQALGLAEDDLDRTDVLLLRAEAELANDDEGAARASLDEVARFELSDPTMLCEVAQLWLELEDYDRAASGYRAALALDDAWADAHYGLGLIHDLRDEREEAIAAYLRAYDLDAAAPEPEWHLPPDEFEAIASKALAELPEAARERLGNVPVIIEPRPTRELVADGVDPRLLGLFVGTPLPEKGFADGSAPSLDGIRLYQLNLEHAFDDADTLAEEIRVTVLHETAHFFGLEDDDLEAIGLG